MSNEGDDIAQRYKRLRRDTARVLDYDHDHLSPSQDVRLDRAVCLRLEIDRLQMLQLAGQPFDMVKLVEASGALEKLISPAGTTGGGIDYEHEFAGAREKFKRLILGRIAETERQMAADPEGARAEFEARLQEVMAKYPKAPAVEPVVIVIEPPHEAPAPNVVELAPRRLPPINPGFV
jgi:hypothetical protein